MDYKKEAYKLFNSYYLPTAELNPMASDDAKKHYAEIFSRIDIQNRIDMLNELYSNSWVSDSAEIVIVEKLKDLEKIKSELEKL